MTIEPKELEELKQIYYRHYGVMLTDTQTTQLGLRLVRLFQIILSPSIKYEKIPKRSKIEA
jgi:hypothetical protein